MKVKIFNRIGNEDKQDFENQICRFIKSKEVIDIKYQTALAIAASDRMGSTGEFEENVLVMYEEPNIIKQKTFEYVADDSKVNDFVKNHDVIKIEHFRATADDITAIVTYRENKEEKNND